MDQMTAPCDEPAEQAGVDANCSRIGHSGQKLVSAMSPEWLVWGQAAADALLRALIFVNAGLAGGRHGRYCCLSSLLSGTPGWEPRQIARMPLHSVMRGRT